jgi:hypothetical protein
MHDHFLQPLVIRHLHHRASIDLLQVQLTQVYKLEMNNPNS